MSFFLTLLLMVVFSVQNLHNGRQLHKQNSSFHQLQALQTACIYIQCVISLCGDHFAGVFVVVVGSSINRNESTVCLTKNCLTQDYFKRFFLISSLIWKFENVCPSLYFVLICEDSSSTLAVTEECSASVCILAVLLLFILKSFHHCKLHWLISECVFDWYGINPTICMFKKKTVYLCEVYQFV